MSATPRLVVLAVVALLFASCTREAPWTVATVDVPGLRAALEEHRGKPILLATFATWDGDSVEALARVGKAGGPLREGGGRIVFLCVDRMANSPLESVTAAVKKLAESRALAGEILVWTGNDAAELDGALPLQDGEKVSAKLPMALGYSKDGTLAGALDKELDDAALTELVAKIRG
ncbi:MAG: hypothetical protein HZB39_19765 [Planctomycetes bacterium]|nr:hypothetical protein [Planctomycetota bacterium]